jgi:hypothetical protein
VVELLQKEYKFAKEWKLYSHKKDLKIDNEKECEWE